MPPRDTDHVAPEFPNNAMGEVEDDVVIDAPNDDDDRNQGGQGETEAVDSEIKGQQTRVDGVLEMSGGSGNMS